MKAFCSLGKSIKQNGATRGARAAGSLQQGELLRTSPLGRELPGGKWGGWGICWECLKRSQLDLANWNNLAQ